jgi:hypothetical protein
MAGELAVYDGREMFGTTRRLGSHDFMARAFDGMKPGTSPTKLPRSDALPRQ